MSLKFGIYLVEQRIISPEQFCGLIKIQQESAVSLPTLAVRRNMLTIKQVARVLGMVEAQANRSFVETALSEGLIDKTDVERLLNEQQATTPSLQKLIVECGLLTQHQTGVLFGHFEKMMATGMKPLFPSTPPATEGEASDATAAPAVAIPQPKFSQRMSAKSYSGQLPL